MSNKSSSKLYIFSEKNIRKYILPHYGLDDAEIGLIKFKDTEKQRAVFKIIKEDKSYCLKKVYFDEKNLLFVYSALEWLWKNNIKTPKLLSTLDGKKYVVFNNMIFILTIWIDGYKCDFDNNKHILESIRQLSNIHHCSRNFFPIEGSEKRVGLSDYYISILKHFNQLLITYNTALKVNDKFSKLYIKNFDDNLELAKVSLEVSSRIDNCKLSTSLCHGDYVNKNILFDENNSIWAIDLDKCKYDYSAHDIAYFLRRLLRRDKTCFDVDLTLSIINEYNKVSHLTSSDIRYIVAYVCFPQKYWKISRDYYKNITKCNKQSFYNLFDKSNDKINYQLNFAYNLIERLKKEYDIDI